MIGIDSTNALSLTHVTENDAMKAQTKNRALHDQRGNDRLILDDDP